MAIGTSQAFRTQNFRLLGNFYDKDNWVGKKGYALSSDENGVHWEADQNETSGIFSGGIMTATIGGTTFNVSAGVGQVVSRTLDIPTGEVKTNTTRVSWNTQSNIALTYRTTHPFSYIYIDENGAVQQQNSSFTDAEYKNKIILGTICHIDLATINLVTNKQNITYGDSHRLYELISTFGPIKRNGLAVSAYTTNLRLKRESGVAFLIGSNYTTNQFEPDSISLNSANPASLCRVYKNGTGGFVFDTNGGSFYTDVDPNKYDNGSGTLQTVNNNQWTIQRLFFFPNNPNDIIAYYGVGIYNSYGDAVTAMATESFSEATITAENAVFLAYLVVRGGALDLSLVSDGKFFQSGAFRNIGAIGGGGGGAGAIILDDLTDVAITTPLDGQFLAYDGGASLWKNSTLNAVNPLVFSGIGTSLTLSLNYATASQPGGVSTSAQTFGGVKTFASNVIVSGNLTVNGSTTTIDAQTLVVKDKNIELGVVASPTDLTADGGGITLKGTTDKTFNWIDATDSWTSSEHLDLASGKAYKINGANVLTSTTLGSGVINSSLQNVGVLTNLTVAGYAHLATTSGNVGIGTTITNAKLDVSGLIRTNVGFSATGAWSGAGSVYGAALDYDNGNNRFLSNKNGSYGTFEWLAGNDGSFTSRMFLNSSGNLSVGTAFSSLKLNVGGSIFMAAGNGTAISWSNDISSQFLKYDSSIDGMILSSWNHTTFHTQQTERMRITSTGNVGIGTTNPSQFLEVRRTTGSAIALLNYNDTVKLNINASSGGAGYVGMVSNHPLILVTNDTEKVKIGTNGNVCIGNGDANNKLSVLGSASIGSNYNIAAPTNGLIVEGSVGIGTNSPAYKLEVASGTSGQQSLVNFRTADSTTANNAGIQIFATPSATATSREAVMALDADGANASGGDYFLIKKRGNSGTTDFEQYSNASMRFGTNFISRATYDMTIANDGNVGIGTISPSARLTIVDNTNGGTIHLVGRTSDDTAAINFRATGDASTYAYISPDTNEFRLYHNDGFMSFYPGGTEKVRIKSDGNVGIGITSPIAKFHASYGTDAQSVKMIGTGGSTNGNFIYSLASDYSDSFGLNVFATNHSNPARANTLVRIHSNETSNGGLPLRVTAQGSITSPTYEALAVNYLGNVGIGTTNPISKLDVRGQTYINNGLGTGSGQALIVAGSGDVQLSDGGSLFFGAYSYGSSTYIRGYDDLDIMYFYSNGTNIMNVRSTGVGIGTANPGAKLEIKDGDLWLNGASSASNPEIRFIDDSGISVAGANIRYNNSDGNLYIEHVYNNAASGIFFRNRTAGTSLSTLSLVNGDVGIANTSPLGSASSGLTLGAIGTIKCFNIGMQNTYGRIRERDQIDALAITTNINDGGVQDSATRSSWKLRMGWGNGQDNFLISRSPVGSNVFADLFYVKADGNIGIGTTSPTEKLHIQNGRLLIDTTSANASGIWMPDTNGNPSIRIVTDTSAAEYCSIINNWGNSSNSGLLVGTTRNDGIAFQVRTGVTTTSGFANNDGSTRMIVLGSGYVGIGTTAPSTNLEVIGTVKATTFEGGFSQISVTTDDATNSSHYIYFGANASGSVNVKASTKIRYNPSTGAFSATTKSFRIPHPTKPEHDLVYGSLESPYHGIRLTGKGKTNGTSVEIILPDYVNTLVDENTVNIQITAYKCAKVFYVENINIKDNKFVVKYDKSWYQKAKDVEFFWDFTAERKDVPKLVVEEKL